MNAMIFESSSFINGEVFVVVQPSRLINLCWAAALLVCSLDIYLSC